MALVVIVDNCSCCNYCSSKLLNKLALKIIPHPQPYKLDWISQEGGVVVEIQVSVPITIGKYEKILCYIDPMEIGHIILERHYKFDHNSYHKGDTNKITFSFQGHQFILCPNK